MKPLARLTQKAVIRAERNGKAKGWHALCIQGYSPAEIAIYSSHAWANDVRSRVVEHAKHYGLPVPVSCAPKRPWTRKVPTITDHRAAFRGATMRTGMALVLTQPMLESLCAIADGVESDRAVYFQQLGAAMPNNAIATRAALTKRGLIDCSEQLTSIGQHLVALLKDAGVFHEADAAIERKQASK